MSEKKKILLIAFISIGIMMIATAFSYAFFLVSEEGTKVSQIQAASVKLHYDEKDMQGISLVDALPMSDTIGKKQNYFEFKVTGQTLGTPLTYYVTARKIGSVATRIPDENVRIALTTVNGTGQQATEPDTLLLDTFSNLTDLTQNGHEEQLLYTGTIPANSAYEQNFRLRMWIKEDTIFAPNDLDEYPFEGKSFSIKINVYTEINQGYTAPDTCTYAYELVGTGKQALEVGDEVKIGTEHFYVLSSDQDTTVLMTKQNVALLGYATPTGSTEGLQYTDDDDYFTWSSGNIPFSKTNYWAGSSNLNNIYDSTKTGTPNYYSTECLVLGDGIVKNGGDRCMIRRMNNETPDNYSIAYYVENYKTNLLNMGANISNIRLVTKDEIEDYLEVNPFAFIGNNFWLGSAKDDTHVYVFMSGSNEPYDESYNYEGKINQYLAIYWLEESDFFGFNVADDNYMTTWYYGVRPALEVPTCSIDLSGN